MILAEYVCHAGGSRSHAPQALDLRLGKLDSAPAVLAMGVLPPTAAAVGADNIDWRRGRLGSSHEMVVANVVDPIGERDTTGTAAHALPRWTHARVPG